MTARVDIFNYALSLLGQPSIQDPDGVGVAEYCRSVYEINRKALLESHPWNFAIERVILAQNVGSPSYEWTYSYNLPSDLLKIYKVYNNSNYDVENRVILTDAETLKLEYIKDVTDTTKFSGLFTQVLAHDIAISIAYVLTQNATLLANLNNSRQRLFSRAKMMDAQESAVSSKKFKSNIELAMITDYGIIGDNLEE